MWENSHCLGNPSSQQTSDHDQSPVVAGIALDFETNGTVKRCLGLISAKNILNSSIIITTKPSWELISNQRKSLSHLEKSFSLLLFLF